MRVAHLSIPFGQPPESIIAYYKHHRINLIPQNRTMNKANLSIITFALAAMLSVARFTAVAQPRASYQVIPLPNQIEAAQGEPFVLKQGVAIRCDSALLNEARLLAQYLKQLTGIEAKVGGKDAGIVLHASLHHANPEAYRLSVCNKGILIDGASAAGTLHGIATLCKSLPNSHGGQVEMPAVSITDAPRFAYRGMMLDVSRHFFGVDEVKQFIDMLALHNMNTFHWHLSDDQGWRIEIKKYPRLTEVGSMRTQTVIGRNPGKWDGTPHGGFYTQEQVRDVIRYAAERHIEVIPEIDMPGHMRAALAAYPHLGCTGGPYDVWTQWGVSDEVLCAGNDSTMQFISDVLNEIIDLFPSKYIHIGGDECPKVRWKECPRCQARIASEGITAKGRFTADDRLQGFVTRFAYNVIKQRGRTMIGWDEVLECDVPSDAVVTSWRGDAGAIDGARRGNRVILSPNTHLYFDFYQSKDTQFEPFAIGGYIPVERVYGFEPVPKQLNAAEASLVMGAQANVWTEYMPSFSQVQYMTMPRMAALAEVLWTDAKHKNYKRLSEPHAGNVCHLRCNGIQLCPPPCQCHAQIHAQERFPHPRGVAEHAQGPHNTLHPRRLATNRAIDGLHQAVQHRFVVRAACRVGRWRETQPRTG